MSIERPDIDNRKEVYNWYASVANEAMLVAGDVIGEKSETRQDFKMIMLMFADLVNTNARELTDGSLITRGEAEE